MLPVTCEARPLAFAEVANEADVVACVDFCLQTGIKLHARGACVGGCVGARVGVFIRVWTHFIVFEVRV